MTNELSDGLTWTSHIQNKCLGIFQAEAGEHVPGS